MSWSIELSVGILYYQDKLLPQYFITFDILVTDLGHWTDFAEYQWLNTENQFGSVNQIISNNFKGKFTLLWAIIFFGI